MFNSNNNANAKEARPVLSCNEMILSIKYGCIPLNSGQNSNPFRATPKIIVNKKYRNKRKLFQVVRENKYDSGLSLHALNK